MKATLSDLFGETTDAKKRRVTATHLNNLIGFVSYEVQYFSRCRYSEESANAVMETYNALVGMIRDIHQEKKLFEMLVPYETLLLYVENLAKKIDKAVGGKSYQNRYDRLYKSCGMNEVINVIPQTIAYDKLKALRQNVMDYMKGAGMKPRVIPWKGA